MGQIVHVRWSFSHSYICDKSIVSRFSARVFYRSCWVKRYSRLFKSGSSTNDKNQMSCWAWRLFFKDAREQVLEEIFFLELKQSRIFYCRHRGNCQKRIPFEIIVNQPSMKLLKLPCRTSKNISFRKCPSFRGKKGQKWLGKLTLSWDGNPHDFWLYSEYQFYLHSIGCFGVDR